MNETPVYKSPEPLFNATEPQEVKFLEAQLGCDVAETLRESTPIRAVTRHASLVSWEKTLPGSLNRKPTRM